MSDVKKMEFRGYEGFGRHEGRAPAQSGMGWFFYEQMATTNNTFDYSDRAYETDEADMFKHWQGVNVEKGQSMVFPVLKVLKDLWGKPWNNLALNFVTGLKPSCIRVSSGSVTCDSIPGRITVWLKKDDRTISSIDFEASTWAIGVKSGEDLAYKSNGIPLPPQSDDPYVHLNEEAIKRIKID